MGMPPTSSNWMWAVCENTYGQNAKSTAAVAAAALSSVSFRASSHAPTTEVANARRTTELCDVNGFPVASQTGTASVPAPIFDSEKASARRCGKKMLASKRSTGLVTSACATQATFHTEKRPSPEFCVRPRWPMSEASGQVMSTAAPRPAAQRRKAFRARTVIVRADGWRADDRSAILLRGPQDCL